MSSVEQQQQLEEAASQDEEQAEAESNMQILTALGFTAHYHDTDKEGKDETNFGIKVLDTKIGVKFNAINPTGKAWAYKLTEDGKKEFIKNGDLKQLPLVQRYHNIQEGKKPIPDRIVTGRIIERVGRGLIIEIVEDGEKKEISFGQGAVKRHDDDGHHYIPSGFSKPSADNPEGKMSVWRDILLPDMDTQTSTPISGADLEVQRIKEGQGRAPPATTIPLPGVGQSEVPPDLTPPIEQKAPTTETEPRQAELIAKYVEMLAQVIVAVCVEDRIPKQEKGFGNKFVFYSVKHALENGKGGDCEEGA